MGSRLQSTVDCLTELCFLQFSVAQVFVLLRKPFINNSVFPTWPVLLVLLIIIIIICKCLNVHAALFDRACVFLNSVPSLN